MTKYRVVLSANLPADAEIEVEANSAAEAEEKAYEFVQHASPGQIEWNVELNFVDDELVEVFEVEEKGS